MSRWKTKVTFEVTIEREVDGDTSSQALDRATILARSDIRRRLPAAEIRNGNWEWPEKLDQ